MSHEDTGKYIRLLCAQHQHGGFIPSSIFESITENSPVLFSKFEKGDSGYFNVRLMSEMETRNKKSQNLSSAAKAMWEKRKDTIALHLYCEGTQKVSKSDTIVMPPEDEDESVISICISSSENTNIPVNAPQLAPVAEPTPVPTWVQEHKALERGDTLKQEIDRLITARPIYGTRMTVTQALGVVKGRGGYDESIALTLLPSRARYERRKGMKTPMKLETLLETGGWAVDWEERLGQETTGTDQDDFTQEEIMNAY